MQLLFTKNVRDIQRRPLRTVLTILGVLLGVAGIVAISYTGRNLAEAQRQTYASTRQPDITASASALSPTLLDLIDRRDNVETVDSRTVQSTRISVGDGWVSTQVIGVQDFSNMELSSIELLSGHLPGRGEVVFDITATNLVDLDIGDLVALQPTAGDPITYSRVSGFVRAPETLDAAILNRATAFMPAQEVRRNLGTQHDNYLLVRVNDPQRASETANEIQRFLDKRGIRSGSYAVRDSEGFTGSRELATVLLLLQVFSVVGAVLSSFLVANTVAAVMIEETRQIGVIKALGGSRWAAMQPYLTFALIIGATGALLGLGLGMLGGRMLTSYLASLQGLVLPDFSVSLREAFIAVGVGLGVAVGSAVIPAWAAARQRVARLLSNLGVVADFRRGLVQRLTGRISQVSVMLAIGARNLSRRPIRSWVTLAVVAIAVAAFTSTQAVSSSVNVTVDSLYDLYGADGWIILSRGVDPDFARVITEHPDVDVAEPWSRAYGSIGSVNTDIWGFPADTDFYAARIEEGGWLRRDNPIAAVVTTNLAERLGARTGDIRTLDIGNKATVVQIVGLVDDESTYLGATTTGKVFLRFEDLQRILGREQIAGLFALQLRSSEPAAVDASLADIEQQYREYGTDTLAMYRDQQTAREAISILTLMLNAMVIIIGAVGLAGIVNTLIINLTERRREFGILRSIGASGGHLVRLILAEAVGLAAIGCLIGLIIGYPLARYLVHLTGEQLFGLDFTLGPQTIILTFVVALVASAAVSTGPGIIASRIRPIQVLRYE